MPDISPLHPALYEKFKLAFGEPDRTEGKDWHWSLRPFAYIAAINVLANGSREHPVVWVFNPHDPKDGVSSTRITEEPQIDTLIRKIEDIVRHAGRPDVR